MKHSIFSIGRSALGALALVAAGGILAAYLVRAAARPPGALGTRRVSTALDGAQANEGSSFACVSADGRYVAFLSPASNLVPGDANQATDIFVKDTSTGVITCASVANDEGLSNGESASASISADGQRIAFVSEGFNLVSSDGNHASDVFVRNLADQTTVRVSVSLSGSDADDGSFGPCLSADGRFVAFGSHATNLVADDTNGLPDVFVRDLQTGSTERISVGPSDAVANGPSEGAALSSDGRFVAFASMATNLLAGPNGGDGTRVWNVYLRDRSSGTTTRVSVGPGGGPGDGNSFVPAISSDGRFIAFASFARNLISSDLNEQADIYLRDTQAGITTRVSVGVGGQEPTGKSLRPSISGDGRYVAFESEGTNLVEEPSIPGRLQVYLRDLLNGTTIRVVPASLLPAPGGGTSRPALSRDGRWLAADSSESDLVEGDTNGFEDVLLRGPLH